MKTHILKLMLVFLALTVFNACSWDPITFDSSKNFVAFQTKTAKVAEDADELQIPVVLAATSGSPSVTVDFEVVTEGSTAIEGEDFEIGNASKSLTFSDGFGTQYIIINPIDNDVFEGNKTFKVKLTSNSGNYPNGAIEEMSVTITDDEHPLKLVLGNYIFAGDDAWGDPFSVAVTTSPVEGNLDQISFPLSHLIPNYGPPDTYLVYAKIDLDEMTMTIAVGQSFASFGYGPCKISGYDGETEDPLSDGDLIHATIDEDGNITMLDLMGVYITEGSNAGASFAIFGAQSVWTKQ